MLTYMATETLRFLSPDEYLNIERAAPFKSEYRDGQMYAMSGASYVHNLISSNLSGEIWSQLRAASSPCNIFSSDLRVHIPATGLYTYPDLVATCQNPKFSDAELDTLLNPILIIEILSKTTERYDRGNKFADYRSIPSLTEYLTIAQDRVHIEQWNLIQNHWTLTEYRAAELAVSVTFQSLPVHIQLPSIYTPLVPLATS